MRKFILFSITLLCVINIYSQNSEVLQIQLKLGEIIEHKGVTIEFKEVVSDSRCPKDAHCIWAGEVVVLVNITKGGKKLEERLLKLSPTSHLQNLNGNLFSSNELNITAFSVTPYPDTKGKIPKKKYCLELRIN